MDAKFRSRRFILAILWTVGTIAIGAAVVFKTGQDPLIGIGITAGLVLGGYGFTRSQPADDKSKDNE